MTGDSIRHDQQPTGFDIAIANEQSRHEINEQQLREAAEAVLRDTDFSSGAVSIAIVDDTAMHELNRRYLEHDWPTDVLSFVLEANENHLEAEIILSADTAAREANEAGWSAAAEQLLYVLHGTLHLVGYRDTSAEEAAEMRVAEAAYLRRFGFEAPRQAERPGADDMCGTKQARGGAAAR